MTTFSKRRDIPPVVLLGAFALLGAAASGCALAAAGIVEASRPAPVADPMGEQYEGLGGELGWRVENPTPQNETASLRASLEQMGCLSGEEPTDFAICPNGTPALRVEADRSYVYRICEPGTDRMRCRMAWEHISDLRANDG